MREGRLRILFVLPEFPARTEAFILDQIIGLLERGHELEIFAEVRGDPEGGDEQDGRYDLPSLTRFPYIGARAGVARVVEGLRALFALGPFPSAPLLRSLNLFRYHMDALSLRLLSAAAALGLGRSYDVVHAHSAPAACWR